MDDYQLIAKLAKKNAELDEENTELKKKLQNIHKMLYCIGGPLNDNYRRYNVGQLQIFLEIVKELES